MDTSHLPLVKNCMDKATMYEEQGDKLNAEKWFNLAVKAEAYYAKQDYKTADEYYKEKHV